MSESIDTENVMELLETLQKLRSNIENARTKLKSYDNEEADHFEEVKKEYNEETEERERKIREHQEVKERRKIELSFSVTIDDNDTDDFASKFTLCLPPSGNNIQYAGRRFGLIMTLNKTDYNDVQIFDNTNNEALSDEKVQLALTMEKSKQPYLNPAGLKFTVEEPNIENDVFQQFTFGNNEWNTVIDSVQQRGMVFDVADEFNFDTSAETPFYLFMFHGRHNQHFIYKDNMIYAKQNGQVVTYVGGEDPFVMMTPNDQLKSRQTFTIKLL